MPPSYFVPGATHWLLRLRSCRYRMWARDGICRDGARVPLPWNTNAAQNHGFPPYKACRRAIAARARRLWHQRSCSPPPKKRFVCQVTEPDTGPSRAKEMSEVMLDTILKKAIR